MNERLIAALFLGLGYLLGIATLNWMYKKALREFTKEVHKGYTEALDRVRKKYRK